MRIQVALKIFNIAKLKSEQEQILRCLLDRTDCIAVLPTGFGKTLPFHMFIPVCRELGLNVGKILVCCPLVSLMQDQVTKLATVPQLTAAYKGKYFNTIMICLNDFLIYIT